MRTFRDFAQIEKLRPVWANWPCHRDSDIDVYLNLRRYRSKVRPYVVLVLRDGNPDAMMVGQIECADLPFKTGYFKFFLKNVDVLTIESGGFMGNQTADNNELLLGEIAQSLHRGDADLAVLNFVQVGSSVYCSAKKRFGGIFARDFFPEIRSHWAMAGPRNAEEIYAAFSKDHRRKFRNQAKKLLAHYSGDVSISRYTKVEEVKSLAEDAEEVARKSYQRGLGVGFENNDQIRELLRVEAQNGWLRGYVLKIKARPAAFWIGALYKGKFYSDFLSFDSEYAKHSPGTFVLTHGMEDLLGDNVTEIDFGPGEGFYKERFGTRRWDEAIIYTFAPSFIGLKLKLLRTLSTSVNRMAKKTLEGTGLLPKLKKRWRKNMVTRSNASQSLENP